MKTITKIVALASLTALVAFGTSCHTVRGAGRDIQDVGHGIQKATY